MTSPSHEPRAAQGNGLASVLAHDLPASLVVFLVAVPLSLGVALASNAPIMAGLLAAVVGGIVVGAVSGAPLQVSGPAAGLVVMVFALTEQMGGDWRAVCAITLLAGLVQLGLGWLRVARVALAISPAVVHGMLAGIGILIALAQLHVVLGGRPQSSPLANLRDLPSQLAGLHGAATLLGLVTIAVLAAWSFVPWPRLRRVPAPLVAVGLATMLALATGADVERIDLRGDDHVHAVEGGVVLDDADGAGDPDDAVAAAAGDDADDGDRGYLLAAVALPRLPDVPVWVLIKAVIALALVASVESLLCAVATDKLHPAKRADLDRELVAQGLGNTLSGLLGGLPVTGVIVRSSANIHAGARTRWSAVLHGAWVLVFVALLPFVVEAIPKSVLAGLLVFVGVRLVNLHHIRELRQHRELPLYLVTVVGVVAIDLLSGVVIGVLYALGRLVWGLARVSIEVQRGQEERPWRVRVEGALTFLGVPRLIESLGRVPPRAAVDVDLAVSLLDHAGWDALDGWRRSHERAGGRVHLDGLTDVWTVEAEQRALAEARAALAADSAPTDPISAARASEAEAAEYAAAAAEASGEVAAGPRGDPERAGAGRVSRP